MAAQKIEPGSPQRSGPRASEVEDEALLGRIAAGDANAFRVLVDRHVGAVSRLARRMLGEMSEAEDIAQEVFLRLWRQGESLEVGPAGVRPWLNRVAANLCLDRLRAGRRVDVTDEPPEVAEAATQLSGLAEADLSRRVEAALMALPERQRLALTLFHFEGHSQVETGRIMGVTDEAVESLLARARRALKAALAADWRALIEE